ncbi:HlyD family efflux transporter periplasmic adaptor subunit [Mesorhizobium sp. VK24D]|uniref:HlyD family efflux transporter periplasmic adaptor subunit n=1 Tax=Mesorhizobium album TaxID=3072314 RepID=A0ABU4Y6H4_9HYPH|nr:HlyD family efflux transporter periplasmic adaptor subunit [Mesorhizobium sp. VK24D]MDX8481524.1 HlyD family efflux transporter periplasmic adaptor subunit [Mesorhizobium sp. VK24D]
MQSFLNRHFQETEEPAAEVVAPQPVPPAASPWTSRLLKSVLGLALVVAAGWMPTQRLLQISSVEAVVNARLVTVRAPISGTVGLDTRSAGVGDAIDAGAPLVTITETRGDRGRLNAALDELSNAEQERQALTLRMQSLVGLRDRLRDQLAAFRKNRLLQIDAEMDEADARIEAAVAEQVRADSIRARQAVLAKSGSVAQSVMDDADRDAAVAASLIKQVRARKAALAVERQALNAGAYLGDDYNDQPRSAQRLDEVEQQIAALEADGGRLIERIARASTEVRDEQHAVARVSEARLTAPVGGRFWEVLTAPGEQVVAGQPLFSLLNCSEAIVTATVSEAVYNSLSIGMPASFTYREGGASLAGRVVQLSGIASASSNFAIAPSALTKEPYRVAISIKGLDARGSCPVGRTGRVVFGSAAS